MIKTEVSAREQYLINSVEADLPHMKEMREAEAQIVILHQDAFAADYQTEEYMLLGKVIKYFGLFGKQVHITGTNRETLEEAK